ncbi:Toxin ParE1 [Halioglobus japonicus]|nr:Toxin ParE1 [Halioglobus japonicus]
MTLTFTQAARADLKSIAIFTQKKWGKAQRTIYTKQFDDAFHMLANNPETGSNCDFIRKGYRKFPNDSQFIFYQVAGKNKIQVVRILHKRMDVARQSMGT